MAMNGLAELLTDCWTASGGLLGGFGCHVGTLDGCEIRRPSEKVLLQEAEGFKAVC